MRLRTALVFLALCALAAGCSALYSMTISGSLERPAASFQRGGAATSVCLRHLEIREAATGAPSGRLVWQLHIAGDHCIALNAVIYGEVPQGFTVMHAAEPLQAGVTYEAFSQGVTTGLFGAPASGSVRFGYHDGVWAAEGAQPNRRQDAAP